MSIPITNEWSKTDTMNNRQVLRILDSGADINIYNPREVDEGYVHNIWECGTLTVQGVHGSGTLSQMGLHSIFGNGLIGKDRRVPTLISMGLLSNTHYIELGVGEGGKTMDRALFVPKTEGGVVLWVNRDKNVYYLNETNEPLEMLRGSLGVYMSLLKGKSATAKAWSLHRSMNHVNGEYLAKWVDAGAFPDMGLTGSMVRQAGLQE